MSRIVNESTDISSSDEDIEDSIVISASEEELRDSKNETSSSFDESFAVKKSKQKKAARIISDSSSEEDSDDNIESSSVDEKVKGEEVQQSKDETSSSNDESLATPSTKKTLYLIESDTSDNSDDDDDDDDTNIETYNSDVETLKDGTTIKKETALNDLSKLSISKVNSKIEGSKNGDDTNTFENTKETIDNRSSRDINTSNNKERKQSQGNVDHASHIVISQDFDDINDKPVLKLKAIESLCNVVEKESKETKPFHLNDHASRKSYRESIVVIESRSPSPEKDTLEISSDEEHFIPPHMSTVLMRRSIDPFAEVNNVQKQNFNANVEHKGLKENCNPNVATNNKLKVNFNPNAASSGKAEVTLAEFRLQQEIVQKLQSSEQLARNTYKSVNLDVLPDKGQAIVNKMKTLQKQVAEAQMKLNNMVVKQGAVPKPVSWKDLEARIDDVQARTQGKKALETLHVQKALTMDRLEQLHGSLKNCPDSNTIVEDPKGLKVELMLHQKQAMAWLLWRENQKPSGGILADDMGLGKTLTMISLALKQNQLEKSKDDSDSSEDETNEHRKGHKYPGGTLVICPASVLFQWDSEIQKHVKRGLVSVDCYHGNNRETKSKRLAKHDFVITTYALVMGDHGRNGPLFGVKWKRLVVDEAHQIRNYKSQTSIAVCSLAAKSRWALTGTPIHNKELDIYALLKFLRCSPFDDLTVWKRWVANKSTGGQDRLNMVISSLILRRTKQQLAEKKMLNCLPDKTWEIIDVTLSKNETEIYQKVLIFSRTLFAQFLHQRAEREGNMQQFPNDPNSAYYQMHKRLVKLNKVKKIKQHEILVLLLRLRQICCHPSLITGMLSGEENLEEFEGEEEFNLLDQMNQLNLEEPEPANGRLSLGGELVGLAEASKNILNPSNPVFSEDWKSSKIKVIMQILEKIINKGEKCIIVSQWTKFLTLVSTNLKRNHIEFFSLDGTVPVNKRMEIVSSINNPSNKVPVLLLSLTAGGVGLNLVGANHLILTDLHWNPQLEMQAQDRIFRVGQTKPVQIYKLITGETIEQRIKGLQDKKLNIADEILTGSKIQNQNKLSLDDLKMLFSK